MPITITRAQRDAIWADLVADLSAIGDIDIALRHDEWAKARELRTRFEQDMRLLDDLGWGQHDPGEQFALTIAPDDLTRTLQRLYDSAEQHAHTHLLQSGIDEAIRSMRAISTVLDQLEDEHDEPTAA